MKPVVKTEMMRMQRLKYLCLREQYFNESVSNYSSNMYMKDQAISVDLKVYNPAEFTLVLDYEYYNFEFKTLLKILMRNDFKKVEVIANTLHRASTPITDGEAMLAWQTGAVRETTMEVAHGSDQSFGGDFMPKVKKI